LNILGISAFYHDSAACLVRDGRIIAAAQEERFTRTKHDAAFPKNSVEYCLRAGGLTLAQVDYVAFYEKPFLKFDRILHSYLAYAPRGLKTFLMAIPLWIRERVWMKTLIQEELDSLSSGSRREEAHAEIRNPKSEIQNSSPTPLVL
jgi:carbamoyltransferase